MTSVIAVDFGATSIRVSRVDLETLDVDVVHRYPHEPVHAADGSLRWDWNRLVDEMFEGLELAIAKGPVASIGIDTWAVDYGLLDGDGKLLSAPHTYRSDRTNDHERVLDRVGRRRFYEICGLQVQPFNTIFQLAAHDPDELAGAEHLLFLPDLLVHHLTGEIATERTSAGSSGLYDLRAGDWSDELIDASGAPRRLFGDIVDAPARAGTWRDIPVVRVSGHDTASAVMAIPESSEGAAFVASGTWLLVGRMLDEPDTSEGARAENFSNELGAFGGIRFLKNVAGYWLLNECLRKWGIEDPSDLLGAAARVDAPTFDATDRSLLRPDDVEAEIRRLAGLPDAGRDVIVRSTVASMARTTADVLARRGDVTEVVVLGGGARDELLCELISRESGLPVRCGPAEASATGNAMVQGMAL